MNQKIKDLIFQFSDEKITNHRKDILQPLVDFIQLKIKENKSISLNFICTHNSRRSHLSQIWAQTMAHLFNIKNVYCYSGGTEATAMFSEVVSAIKTQGFQVQKLAGIINPVFAIKFSENAMPIICFSKTYNNEFNPKNNFAAILNCNSADEACPVVIGANERIPIKYNDPKEYDNTVFQTQKYEERSLEIAQEMWWVFKTATTTF